MLCSSCSCLRDCYHQSLWGKNGRGDRDIDAIYFCNGLSESATHLQNKDRCFNWPMARRLFFYFIFSDDGDAFTVGFVVGFFTFRLSAPIQLVFRFVFNRRGEDLRMGGKKTNIMDCKPPNNRLGNRWLMNTHGAQWPRTIIHCAYLNSVSLLNSWTLFFIRVSLYSVDAYNTFTPSFLFPDSRISLARHLSGPARYSIPSPLLFSFGVDRTCRIHTHIYIYIYITRRISLPYMRANDQCSSIS